MIKLQEKVNLLRSRLSEAAKNFQPIAFASSLSAEDMVLTDLILRERLNISIFTIDTLKLHKETLTVIEEIFNRYNYRITIYTPTQENLSYLEKIQRDDDIFTSLEARKECCLRRKVLPLKEALTGKKAWMTGQRRSQSSTRSDLEFQSFDRTHGLEKFNPLADWSMEEIWSYIKSNQVLYNKLHDQNFPSIGCAPCTRAVEAGGDPRSGRWWWENNESKECGLHIVDGKLIRKTKNGGYNVN